MATIEVVFDDVWICDVANPAVTVTAHSPDREHSAALDGDVRYYAGGRARVVTTPQDARTYPLTLQWLTAADVVLLESWRGRVVLLRDGFGRREFGTYLAVSVTDRYLVGGWGSVVSLTFTRLTYDEAVT